MDARKGREHDLQARVEAIVQQNQEWKQQLQYMEHQIKELRHHILGDERSKFRTEKPRRKLPKYVFTYLAMLKKRTTPTHKAPVEIVVSSTFYDTNEIPKEEVALDQDKELIESEQDKGPRYDKDEVEPGEEGYLFVPESLGGTTVHTEEPVVYDTGSNLPMINGDRSEGTQNAVNTSVDVDGKGKKDEGLEYGINNQKESKIFQKKQEDAVTCEEIGGPEYVKDILRDKLVILPFHGSKRFCKVQLTKFKLMLLVETYHWSISLLEYYMHDLPQEIPPKPPPMRDATFWCGCDWPKFEDKLFRRPRE
ncbi:hypothetical protein HanOQP8_Chr16g0630431 [Helianthus annuus]|nr:hypothetical protein HanHA89_Chr16g0675621 [Helianthus annuus]KAJ0646013.1 hypothetical protein HanOQP8_Chr16g0630431 [Helianthus annuus]